MQKIYVTYIVLSSILIIAGCNKTGKQTNKAFIKSTFSQIKSENGYNSNMFDNQLKKPISIGFVQKKGATLIYLDSVTNKKEHFFDIKYGDSLFIINAKSFLYGDIKLISTGFFEGEKGFDYYFYLN